MLHLYIGTQWTASAHIVTAIIGSGVLSLAWGVAQLGWILGVTTLVIFSAITLYASGLLADCYRFPDPISGKRNYTYMEVVKAHLGISFNSNVYLIFTHFKKILIDIDVYSSVFLLMLINFSWMIKFRWENVHALWCCSIYKPHRDGDWLYDHCINKHGVCNLFIAIVFILSITK